MAHPGIASLVRLALSLLALLHAVGPALAAQGPGVAEGTAGPGAQAAALAFILALPLTLLLIGLRRLM